MQVKLVILKSEMSKNSIYEQNDFRKMKSINKRTERNGEFKKRVAFSLHLKRVLPERNPTKETPGFDTLESAAPKNKSLS